MATPKPSSDSILRRLRKGCMALPGTTETVSFGHPTFQVRSKTFAVLEEYKGELSICVKVGQSMQDVFLVDPRFYRTPYVGKYGWISLKVYAAPLEWEEIGELLKGSHALVGGEKGGVKDARQQAKGKGEVTVRSSRRERLQERRSPETVKRGG